MKQGIGMACMIGSLCLVPLGAWAQAPQAGLTLADAEKQALQSSRVLQVKKLEWEAAQNQTQTRFAGIWPRLSLDGSWNYMSTVPTLEIDLPMMPPREIAMGDNTSYSFGPRLSWRLWDSGATTMSWRAAQAGANAKEADRMATQREMVLKTRLAYFQTQLALQQEVVLTDSVRLAQAQYRDIQGRTRLGASSRMDELSSHVELLARQQQLHRARTEAAVALRELLYLTGNPEQWDPTRPADDRVADGASAQEWAPTVRVTLDSLDTSQARLEAAAKRTQIDPQHPRVKALMALAEMSRMAEHSMNAQHWPQVSVSAQAGWEYPNGQVLETIQQNRINVSASWPLWENRRVVNQAQEQEKQTQSYELNQQDAAAQLELTWNKTQDRFAQLKMDQEMDVEIARETEALAKLAYAAYRAGRSQYLEVQAANLRTLEASTRAAITHVQILIQLATLDSLSAEGEIQP